MDERMIGWVKDKGLGEVKRVLHTAVILREGWEMDNRGWIVEMADGRVVALTTNHCYPVIWTREDMEEDLKDHERAANAIREATARVDSEGVAMKAFRSETTLAGQAANFRTAMRDLLRAAGIDQLVDWLAKLAQRP